MQRPDHSRAVLRFWRSAFALVLTTTFIFSTQTLAVDPNLPGATAPTLSSNGAVPGITPATLGKYSPAKLGLPAFNFGGIGACLGAQAISAAEQFMHRGSSSGSTLNGVDQSLVGTCPTYPIPDEKVSCESIEDSSGVVDPALVSSKETAFKNADKMLTCQTKKLASIGAHLTCLDSQMQDLNNFLNTSKARYTDVINQAKQNLAQIDQIVDSRKGQLDTIGQRLNGGPDGSEGLRQVAKDAKAYITGPFPGKILQITAQQKAIDKQAATLAELRKTEQARIAATCFRQEVTRSDFRCGRTAGDKPVSAYDFVLCRVEQNSYIGNNGQVEQNANRTAKAGANRSGLQSVLDAILRDMPLPQEGAVVTNADRVLSPADIDRLYGAQLRKYAVPGFNTYDIVMKTLTSCFNKGSNDIVALEQKPGTLLYENAFALKNNQESQAVAVDTLLTESSEVYDTITKALTGLSTPVNPATCRASPPAQQIQCLNDLKANMQNLLSGNGSVSPQVINITGTMPEHNINFRCNGVNGCLAAYEGYYRSVDTEVKRVTAYRTKFISDSNTNLGKITTSLQSQAQQQMKMLNDYKSQLNSMLSNLGVDKTVDFKNQDPEKPTYGGSSDPKNGIMDQPSDMAKFLGLPDLQDGAIFSDVKSAVAKKLSEDNGDLTKMKLGEDNVKIEEKKCGKEARKAKVTALQNAMDAFRKARCSNDISFETTDPVRTIISDLGDAFKEINGSKGSYGGDVTVTLRNGLGNPSRAQIDTLNRKIQADTERANNSSNDQTTRQLAQSQLAIDQAALDKLTPTDSDCLGELSSVEHALKDFGTASSDGDEGSGSHGTKTKNQRGQ